MVSKLLKAIITVAIIGTVLFALCLALYSCNPARKIEKAEQEVITRPQSLRKVGLIWANLNPCANDTSFITIPGKTDSVKLEIPIPTFDSFAYQIAIQNLKDTLGDRCNEAIKNAFDTGMSYAYREIRKIKVPQRIDTAKYFIVDKRGWKLLDDSLQRAERHISALEAQNEEQRTQLSEARKTSNKWLWYFIFAIAGAVATNTLWILLKIKGR